MTTLTHEHICRDQARLLVRVELLDPAGLPVAGHPAGGKTGCCPHHAPDTLLVVDWARAAWSPWLRKRRIHLMGQPTDVPRCTSQCQRVQSGCATDGGGRPTWWRVLKHRRVSLEHNRRRQLAHHEAST